MQENQLDENQLACSLDIAGDKRMQLQALFPEAFTEGKIDFERLKAALGENLAQGNERYELSWAGKADARREIQKQTTATLCPDEANSVNFGETENFFIEGENLEVLRTLQKAYFGKVKMIYIDPPYNTGNDSFVYPDDYSERLEEYRTRTGEIDEAGFVNKQDMWKKNTRENGQFHSVWLSMMYPRLFLARNLLRDDGVIFVSIDDNEMANLKLLMDEVFGEDGFVALFPWRKRTAKSDVPFGVSQDFEWVFCYAKQNTIIGISHERKYYQTEDFPNDRWRLADITTQRSAEERPKSAFNMVDPKTEKNYEFNPKRVWGVTKDTFSDYYQKGKIVFPDDYSFLKINRPAFRVFESEDQVKAKKKFGVDNPMKAVSTLMPKDVGMSETGNKDVVSLFGYKAFSFPKPASLIKHFVNIINDEDALILDFFSGSATLAQAVLELNEEDGGNRNFICVQMPEKLDKKSDAFKAGYQTIADIARTRIQKVIAQIQEKRADSLALEEKQPLGFNAFRLIPSNFKEWRYDIDNEYALATQLELHLNSEKPEALAEAMVYELLLKSALPLTTPLTRHKAGGQTLYLALPQDRMPLLMFFDALDDSVVDFIYSLKGDAKPGSVLCLNRVFADSQAQTNFSLSLKDAGIELTVL